MAAKKEPQPAWRSELDAAFELLTVGMAYAEDGAYLTAGDRLEAAAAKFRKAYGLRMAAMAKAMES